MRQLQKIGIIGSGRIAGRFIPESKLVSGVSVQGVYNPNKESAEAFARKHEINAYTGIEALYADIDAVYIASPHQTHYAYIKDALEHGKHVLCEKPMVLKKKQAEELFAYVKERGLVLFEGIKTAYCPGFDSLTEIACSGVIGHIRYIDACFTKLESEHVRELTDRIYGGSFTELGSYCLLPIIKLFGTDYSDLRFDSICNDNGVDIFTKASLTFPEGIATTTCGLGVKSEGRLLIGGTKGYIVAEAPWWKTTDFEIHYEDASRVDKFSESFLGDGLRYEIQNFLNLISGNDKNKFKLISDMSIAIADVMEKFLESQNRGVV